MTSITMRTFSTIACAATVLALPASAAARGWSPSAVLLPSCGKPAFNCSNEPAPRAAINARGQTVVAWVDSHTRVEVAAAGPSGRFGRVVTLGKGLRPSSAISANGTQLVGWSNAKRLHFARRTPGPAFARQLTLPASGGGEDDSPKLVAQPDGSTIVLFENTFRDAKGTFHERLRSVVMSAKGRLGKVAELGAGSIHRDGFRAASNGQAAVCCLAGGATAYPLPAFVDTATSFVASYAPGAGWSTLKAPLVTGERIETVGPGGGAVALGSIAVRNRGDAGNFGIPGLLHATVTGIIGPEHAAPVVVPRRAFGPVVTVDGAGRDVLVYQEKDRSAAFSRIAPVYAVTAAPQAAFGPRTPLDRGESGEPAVARYRGGAIIAWQAPGHRWRVSLERAGRFAKAPAPSGSGPSNVGEDFNYNHDMATSGRYVVLCWTALDGSIRASVGTL